MNGQVPGKLTYHEWLKRQNSALQKEVLGATRYKLWKQGKLSMDQMYSSGGQKLTLEQLRKKSEASLQTAYENPWAGAKELNEDLFYNYLQKRVDKLDNLPYEVNEAVQDYTGHYYDPVNKYLRSGLEFEGNKREIFVRNMDRAIENMEPLKESVKGYRGLSKVSDNFINNLVPGTIISDPAYMSTSVDILTSKAFSYPDPYTKSVLFDLVIPKGIKALPGNMKEMEFILPRGTRIIIDKVVKTVPRKGVELFNVYGKVILE